MLRLRVAEYFDSVVNEIDLFTETKIQSIKTQTEEDWWNKRRQEQIDEVRRIERACLDHVNTLKVEEKEIESGEWMKRVFVEYCFTVNFDGLVYLVKANRYVEPKEKRFLDVHLNKNKNVNLAINNQHSLGMSIEEFEVGLRDNFLSDAPVIDISSGLDQCFSIKSPWISDTYVTQQNPIYFDIEDLLIQKCYLSFYIKNAVKEKKAVNVIKCLMTCRDHINTITIHLQYYDYIDPSQDMIALAQSIELSDPVKFVFYKYGSSFQEFGLSDLLERQKYHRSFFVSVTNWQFISDISFRNVSLEDLENADLSSFHSLKTLDLNISSTGKSSSDWKFLDACRASLERLDMGCYERIPGSLSCRTFSRMTKLKSLSLSGPFSVNRDSQEELFADLIQLEKLDIDNSNSTKPFPLSRKTFCTITNLRELILRGAFSIEANNQEELFADLILLKKLDMFIDNELALTTKWFIHSSTVKELRLSFDKLPKIAASQITFKLPQLASLQLFFFCDRIECDLTEMMSCFLHVKKLRIRSSYFDIMSKGWFNRLTCVEELELDLKCEGHINSQVFEEFNHLTKLKIQFWSGNTLDRCAFNKLVHLETIILINCNYRDPSIDTEDKSMFNGLNSLRTIEFGCNYRSYVYFQNLDRFLLVVT